MKYFAALLTMKDVEKSETYRQVHLDYLEALRKEKRILQYGRLANDAGGLIIYQGKDAAEVEEWVKNDPYILEGARNYELNEWFMQSDYQFTEK